MSVELEHRPHLLPLLLGVILVTLLTLITSRWGLGYLPVLGGSVPLPGAGQAP